MIVINNIGVNYVYLTLGEANISTPTYLFKTTKSATGEKIEFELNVVETGTRWDKCEIDGTQFNTGQYNYEVTESGKLIEIGLMVVTDEQPTGWDSLVQYEQNGEIGEQN